MFKGIQKTTLVDFPGRIAATLFTGGCNFRCPWCHNFDLVDPARVSKLQDIPTNEVLAFLETRIGKLDGICVTGGEPTLWNKDLLSFFRITKQMGFENKLDTNGYLPDTLKKFLSSGVIDFIAMDIKNSPQKYAQSVGLQKIDIDKITSSVHIIQKWGGEHEFRTTKVPDLVFNEDVKVIQDWIGEPLTLQSYREI